MTRRAFDLNDSGTWPFPEGAEEIVIRVSRYDGPNLDKPVAYQAIVKGRNRNRVWGVGVMASPVAALTRAIEDFRGRPEAAWPSGKPAGNHREPLVEEAAPDEDVDDFLGI